MSERHIIYRPRVQRITVRSRGPQGAKGAMAPAPSGAPNLIFATNPSGSAVAQATLRALVEADIPFAAEDATTKANAAVSTAEAYSVQRANHTGTQLLATISDAGNAAGKNVGTSAGTVAAGDDSRLTDSRTPTAHASSHASAGSDPITIAESQVTGLVSDLALKAPLASPALTGTPTVPTAAANTNTTQAASTAFVLAQVALSVAGLLELKGSTDASANPNYPAAEKGDTYYITVAGKIGGASGKSVDVGDAVVASADNAGGVEASVGASWFVLEHNLAGVLLSANNLSDLQNAATARGNLGLGTAAVQDATAFDAAGAAAAAQSAATSYADAGDLNVFGKLILGTVFA